MDYMAAGQVAAWLGIEMDQTRMRKLQLLEIAVLVGRAADPAPAGKPCRHPSACGLCAKTCGERLP
jgi:hypothetical protein